jgi:hypothetical protein
MAFVAKNTRKPYDSQQDGTIPPEILEAIWEVCESGFGEVVIKIQQGRVTCVHQTRTHKLTD